MVTFGKEHAECQVEVAPLQFLVFPAAHTFVVKNPLRFDLMAATPPRLKFRCEPKAKHDELLNSLAISTIEGITGA